MLKIKYTQKYKVITMPRTSKKVKKRVVKKRIAKDPKFDEYEEKTYTQNANKLMESLKKKLKFKVFNPDTYVVETSKEIIIVEKNQRRTSEIMTLYEFTEVTSHRAAQIEKKSPIFVDIGDESDPIKMAEMEIRQKKCPLSIMRFHNDIIAEVWEVNEMEMP